MPRLTDLTDIRARLERDRPWAAFSLADLDPPDAEHAQWFGPPLGSAVVLVYDAYDPPILVCHGDVDDCATTLTEPDVQTLTTTAYVNMTPAQSDLLARQFRHFDRRPMVRMLLEAHARAREPASTPKVERLGPSDLDALRALYAEEPPAFFRPAQLRDGVYCGVRDGHDLIAVAGTHVVSTSTHVAALGNVHTRHDRRGLGLATAVTLAVCAELAGQGITTCVLNIVASNHAARRVYERVGFREYCRYDEGIAER